MKIETNIPKEAGIEGIWLKIQNIKLPAFIIGCMYGHSKAHSISFDYIQDVLRNMDMGKKTIILPGDFNDDLLQSSSKFSRFIKNNKLSKIIRKPT